MRCVKKEESVRRVCRGACEACFYLTELNKAEALLHTQKLSLSLQIKYIKQIIYFEIQSIWSHKVIHYYIPVCFPLASSAVGHKGEAQRDANLHLIVIQLLSRFHLLQIKCLTDDLQTVMRHRASCRLQ